MLKIGKAWAPSHATLIFAVPKQYSNVLEMSSLGLGFNFEAGITTSVTYNTKNTTVLWNGKEIDGKVSKTAIQEFLKYVNHDGHFNVNHESLIPIGCGLSTSGAGAISLVYALDQLFETKLSREELNDLAHIADVTNHTGLGSVVGQVVGGIELRLSQGSPSRSKTKSYYSDTEVIIAIKGPLSTSDVLTSSEKVKQVTQSGLSLIHKIEEQEISKIEDLILLGNQFMTSCGLLTPSIEYGINQLSQIGESLCTMAMIGESLIIIPKHKDNIHKWGIQNNWLTIETRISNILPKSIH